MQRNRRTGASRVVMIVGIGMTFAAVVLGIAVAYAMTKKPANTPKDGTSGEMAETPAAVPGQWDYIPFDPIVVSLAGERRVRYLQVTLTLKAKKEIAKALRPEIEGDQKAVLKNWLLVHLSDKRVEDIDGGAAIKRLQREIEDGFNAILFENCGCKVNEVLFEEFNIQ